MSASASKSAEKSAARFKHRRWNSDGRDSGKAGGEDGDDVPDGRDVNLLQLQPFQRQVRAAFAPGFCTTLVLRTVRNTKNRARFVAAHYAN